MLCFTPLLALKSLGSCGCAHRGILVGFSYSQLQPTKQHKKRKNEVRVQVGSLQVGHPTGLLQIL